MIEKLKQTLEQHKDEYIKHLSNLVAIDTQDIGHGIDGGREEKGQEYMLRLFGHMKADKVQQEQMKEEYIQKSLKLHEEGNEGHNYDGRYNVYATFKGEKDKSLMFNGHIDTMPPGNEALWTSPPFAPEIRDGKLYGLGACDMKGGLMAAVMAVKLFQDAGIPLPVDVVITSVVDEEGGGNGSIVAALNGQKADAVVVCEPTARKLIVANMGFVFFKVEVEGRAIHSASKWLGVSAIEKAWKIIRAIDELEHKWLLNHKHPLLPPPSNNVGVIEGGVAGSTIADYCAFKTCVHYHPGTMNHKAVVKEYTDAINLCCEGDEWLREHKPKISIYQAGGAYEIDADAPIVKKFQASFALAMGSETEVIGSPAGCDSRVWQNIAKCPTVQYGPGRQSECHIINEYIEVSDYLDAILIYAGLIMNWAKE